MKNKIIALLATLLLTLGISVAAAPAYAVAKSQTLNTCTTPNGSASATVYWDTSTTTTRSYINKIVLRSYTFNRGHSIIVYADSGTRTFTRNSPGTSTFYPNPLPYEDSSSVVLRLQQNVIGSYVGCNYTLPLR